MIVSHSGDPPPPTRRARILVVASDILPLPGFPTTGAGLRAWGLGQGLRCKGHKVTFAMQRSAAKVGDYQQQEDVLLFEHHELGDVVQEYRHDLLVFQHWPLVHFLRGRYEHTVIDLAGPLLLETLFRDGAGVVPFYANKVQMLRQADFFTCLGERQRNYFYGWLQMAGFDLRDMPIQVVPFGFSPELPRHEYPQKLTFVYGGVFLPWQNPTLGLRVLLEELERAKEARLCFFGGKHPLHVIPAGEYEKVVAMLKRSSQTTLFPMIQYRELNEHYRTASVAWDVMSHNCERGMAITSRTVDYMWAGLPVVYNDYAELSEYIRNYNAGWLVNPDDADEIRAVIREIFRNPEEVQRRGQNGQRLVREKFTWDKAAEPLHHFALHPKTPHRFPLTDPPQFDLRKELLNRIKRRLHRFPVTYKIARLAWAAAKKGASVPIQLGKRS